MVFGRSGIGSKALLSCFVLLKTYTIRCEQDKLDHQTETINFFLRCVHASYLQDTQVRPQGQDGDKRVLT